MENKSYAEKVAIKKEALNKLDRIIQLELDRLYALSPINPIYDQFELVNVHSFLSSEEIRSVRRNIRFLQNIKTASNEAEQRDALQYFAITLLVRPIIDPWSAEEDNDERAGCRNE